MNNKNIEKKIFFSTRKGGDRPHRPPMDPPLPTAEENFPQILFLEEYKIEDLAQDWLKIEDFDHMADAPPNTAVWSLQCSLDHCK